MTAEDMTLPKEDRHRIQTRDHQQLLRDWRRKKGPCIICAEREGVEGDHLSSKGSFSCDSAHSRNDVVHVSRLPKVQQGLIGKHGKHWDTLLVFLLPAARNTKYDRWVGLAKRRK